MKRNEAPTGTIHTGATGTSTAKKIVESTTDKIGNTEGTIVEVRDTLPQANATQFVSESVSNQRSSGPGNSSAVSKSVSTRVEVSESTNTAKSLGELATGNVVTTIPAGTATTINTAQSIGGLTNNEDVTTAIPAGPSVETNTMQSIGGLSTDGCANNKDVTSEQEDESRQVALKHLRHHMNTCLWQIVKEMTGDCKVKAKDRKRVFANLKKQPVTLRTSAKTRKQRVDREQWTQEH